MISTNNENNNLKIDKQTMTEQINPEYDVYEACLRSATVYTQSARPETAHLSYMDRFTNHLQKWEQRYWTANED